MTSMSRRGAIGAGALFGASALGMSVAEGARAATKGGEAGAGKHRGGSIPEETKSLDSLYADALCEGGELVVYAGGDTQDQLNSTRDAFLASFPNIELTMVADYSKYHDARIDHQLATDTLIPDVVQLQTLHDFPRWKARGVLRPYKPAGFSALYPHFRDPDGAWVAVAVYAFSFMYDATALGSMHPASPHALADPRWKGAIASTYPHDDDAALYLYRLYVQAYGWDWLRRLASQELQFRRGSHTPLVAVASKEKAIGIGGAGSLTTPLVPGIRWLVPGGHPFMAWGQRAAILTEAKNPAAAKLYLNWQLSTAMQRSSFNGWSVRTDVAPEGGIKRIWEYQNANLDGFPRFMADRAEVERWKQIFALHFGEVQGAPSPGSLGLRPGQA